MNETKSTSTDYNEWYSQVVDINERFTCDKCGKKWRVAERSRVVINWATPENTISQEYQLCNKCKTLLLDWIKGENNE